MGRLLERTMSDRSSALAEILPNMSSPQLWSTRFLKSYRQREKMASKLSALSISRHHRAEPVLSRFATDDIFTTCNDTLASSKIGVPLTTLEQGSSLKQKKESEYKRAVQFGWTLHMLHANTLQYAWMWSWFNNHSGPSGQNVGM